MFASPVGAAFRASVGAGNVWSGGWLGRVRSAADGRDWLGLASGDLGGDIWSTAALDEPLLGHLDSDGGRGRPLPVFSDESGC